MNQRSMHVDSLDKRMFLFDLTEVMKQKRQLNAEKEGK